MAHRGTPRCAPRDLGIHFAGAQGAAGTLISRFQFINVSGHACYLRGYPGAAAYGRDGRRLAVVVDRENLDGRPVGRVVLRPRGRASFKTTAVQRAAGHCVYARHLRFTPPDDRGTIEIALRLAICGPDHDLNVTPVRRASS